ncbi:hypothetical protein NQZ68_003907 [Dissostichus eleginoides]|nr:hypothetical protein NQZ68_003907 [Dissostichus eleginoides]
MGQSHCHLLPILPVPPPHGRGRSPMPFHPPRPHCLPSLLGGHAVCKYNSLSSKRESRPSSFESDDIQNKCEEIRSRSPLGGGMAHEQLNTLLILVGQHWDK